MSREDAADVMREHNAEQQDDCELCEGCGEIETTNKRGDRMTVPCPTCVSRELNARIAMLEIAVTAEDLAPADQVRGAPVPITLTPDAWAEITRQLLDRKLLDPEASAAERVVPLVPLAFVLARPEGDAVG